MVDLSHRGFDIIKGGNFIFENNTLNESMLDVKQIKNNQNDLHFGLIFLTC